MIYINKNQSNTVIIELTDVSSLLAPYYLFEFINDMDTSMVKYFTGTDLSNFKCRYNMFDVIETGSTYQNLTASTISLLSGSWNYNV